MSHYIRGHGTDEYCQIIRGSLSVSFLDLCSQVLVVAAPGVASVRSCQKLPPCLTEPMLTVSRPTLAKAVRGREGSASVITLL